MPAKFQVVIARPNSTDLVVEASSAKSACEIAAKAVHDGNEAIVKDASGAIISEQSLAELVKRGE